MAFTIIRHNVLNDQEATQQTQVDGHSLEIGRGSGNALMLDDLHISLRHAVIEYVEVVDSLTARLHLSSPAPWLPSQIAPWLALLPPGYAADPANEYLLVSRRGVTEVLERLAGEDPDLAHFRFRDACGYEASPKARRVRQFFESGAARPVAVDVHVHARQHALDRRLAEDPAGVLD